MSHFAKLDADNYVIFVTVGRQEDDGNEAALCERTGERYVQTSYNTRGGIHYTADNQPSPDQSKALRKNYAGIGFFYDETRDAFIPPRPSEDAVLSEESCLWIDPEPQLPQEP